jgi:hypothetical protein
LARQPKKFTGIANFTKRNYKSKLNFHISVNPEAQFNETFDFKKF